MSVLTFWLIKINKRLIINTATNIISATIKIKYDSLSKNMEAEAVIYFAISTLLAKCKTIQIK